MGEIFDQWYQSEINLIEHLKKEVPQKTLDYFAELDYFDAFLSLRHICWAWKETESPIEQLMYLGLTAMNSALERYYDIRFYPQCEIKLPDKTYRVDFLVAVIMDGNLKTLVVECDGHDFHEKTKSQAKKDKQRDRKLMAAGFHVMHFTGSEIHNNTNNCINEISKFLFGKGYWDKVVELDFHSDKIVDVDIPNTEKKITYTKEVR